MNEQNHFDFPCQHEWKENFYCSRCGLWINLKDIESNECPYCSMDSEYLHECEHCGEKISHEKYLQLN